MPTSKTMLRDSAIALAVMVLGALALWGLDGVSTPALGVLAGGLIGLANLAMLGRLVENLTLAMATEQSSGGAALGLMFKSVVGLALFFFALQTFGVLPVLAGAMCTVLAITLRGVLNLFAPRASAQEA